MNHGCGTMEYRHEGQPGYDPEDFGDILDLPDSRDELHKTLMEDPGSLDYGCLCNIGYCIDWKAPEGMGMDQGPVITRLFDVDTDDESKYEADADADTG
jgi:hypothetical protein